MQQITIIERNDSPVAFEFHNEKTGHCYVDYIEREGMTEKEGYSKVPLYKLIDGCIVINKTEQNYQKEFDECLIKTAAIYESIIEKKTKEYEEVKAIIRFVDNDIQRNNFHKANCFYNFKLYLEESLVYDLNIPHLANYNENSISNTAEKILIAMMEFKRKNIQSSNSDLAIQLKKHRANITHES